MMNLSNSNTDQNSQSPVSTSLRLALLGRALITAGSAIATIAS